MRVETDLKLGFKDVLIRPKRSTLKSRALVELERTFTFLHSKKQWSGVPIIAANMDTIGTFEVAEVLAENRMLCAIHKHYSLADWQDFLDRQKDDDENPSRTRTDCDHGCSSSRAVRVEDIVFSARIQ